MSSRTSATRRRGLAALGLASLLLAACSLKPRLVEREPQLHDDVGEVGVAVVSAAPWELFIKDLQPDFALTSEEALAEASATTRQLEDSFLKAVQLAVKVAPETLTTDRKTETAPDASGNAKTTETITSKSGPGDVSKVTGPTVPSAGLPAPLKAFDGDVSVNPTLRYQLATALYQEVKLLNRYVRSAPTLSGYDRFVVRLQVSVRQFGRNTPYDTDLNIAFAPQAPGTGPVVAIPLLATDNLEVTSAAVARQKIQSLGVALSLLRGNFGASVDYGKRTEELLRAFGNEFNSLLTVSRGGSDSTINVRIGAMNKGVDTYEMVSRSHLVTVLLLVPRAAGVAAPHSTQRVASLNFKARSRFLNARSGALLPGRDGTLGSAHLDSSGRFEVAAWPDPSLPPANQRVRVRLAGEEPPYAATLSATGAANLVTDMLARACLTTTMDRAAGCNGPEVIFADTLQVAPKDYRRDEVEVSFGAMFDAPGAAAGLTLKGGPSALNDWLCLEVNRDDDGAGRTAQLRDRCIPLGPTLLVDPPKKPPPALTATVLVSDAQLLASREGAATLSLQVGFPSGEKRPQRVLLQVQGAGIAGLKVTGGAGGCAVLAASVTVTGDCSFVLALTNASPRAAVKLSATAEAQPAGKKLISVPLTFKPDVLDVFAVWPPVPPEQPKKRAP